MRAKPRASMNEIVGWRGGELHVRVAAPPVDDEANRAVLALLAQILGVPRSTMTILKGAHGRSKVIQVRGLSVDAIEAKLATAGTPG